MPGIAERLRAIVEPLPPGAAVMLPADIVRTWLDAEPAKLSALPAPVPAVETWREKLWTCPTETRLGVHELKEAMGRSRDWVYRATNSARAAEHGRNPLPCSRMDGELVFTAGAVRQWLHSSELIVNPAPKALTLHEQRKR